MLDPNLIRPDMTPAEVLRAMLPVVREAFERGIGPSLMHARRQHRHMAILFASHVLSALMQVGIDGPEASPYELMAALTAFRDAWCAAAENATKETT